MGGKPQRDGTIFMGEVDPSRHHEKIFNLAIGGGLGWIKGLKNGARKSLYFMQLFLLLTISLFKSKYLYIQYA